MSRQGQSNMKGGSRQGKKRVKERSRQLQSMVKATQAQPQPQLQFNGFDTIEINLVFFKNLWNTRETSLNRPWNFSETPLKLPWNTLKRPRNSIETFLKHSCNALKHPWNFLKNPRNFREITLKFSWNIFETPLWISLECPKNGLGILLKHHYSDLGRSLEHPGDTHETHLASNALNAPN